MIFTALAYTSAGLLNAEEPLDSIVEEFSQTLAVDVALRQLDSLIDDRPDFADAVLCKVRLLSSYERWDEAQRTLQAYKDCEKDGTVDPALSDWMGYVSEMKESYEDEVLRTELRSDRALEGARARLVLRDTRRAIQWARIALTLGSDGCEPFEIAGYAYAMEGHYDEAYRLFVAALDRAPTERFEEFQFLVTFSLQAQEEKLLNQGMNEYRRGHYNRAAQYFLTLWAMEPFEYGYVLLAMNALTLAGKTDIVKPVLDLLVRQEDQTVVEDARALCLQVKVFEAARTMLGH